MCLNKTCSRVGVGTKLFDIFPIKNGLIKGDVWLHVTVRIIILNWKPESNYHSNKSPVCLIFYDHLRWF
jgi:hypothetical protein